MREELAQKEPKQGIWKVMGFSEPGPGEMVVGPKGKLSLCFSFAKTSLATNPRRPLCCVCLRLAR